MLGTSCIRNLFAISVFLLFAPLAIGDDRDQSEPAHKDASNSWKNNGWPLIKKFCIECHNADYQEAEVDLSNLARLDSNDPLDSSMQRVLEMVRFGAMPPEDAELPTDAERKQMVTALDNALYAVTCDLRPRPGKVTARRLNRAEYNNTIRDLFGMDLRPADGFPSDEVGAGFDNNGDVLSLSPMQIEKYLDAAERVADKVIIDPRTLPKLNADIPSDRMLIFGDTKTGRFNGRFLAKDGFASFEIETPMEGKYYFKVRGGASNRAEKSHVAIYYQDGTLVEYDELKYFGGGGRSESFSFDMELAKGRHRFFMEPIEDGDEREFQIGKDISESFRDIDPELVRNAQERAKNSLKPDDDFVHSEYPFMFRQVHVNGPSHPPEHLLPPAQKKLIRRTAKYDSGKRRWTNVDDSARECLTPFIQRAFRGPVRPDEVEPYVQLVELSCKRGDSFYLAMKHAITAVLVSPRFLFRVESPPEDWKPKENETEVRLSQYQLATRLSYFLWSSTPDERLLEDANRNKLKDDHLRWTVRRMVQDKRSDSLASEFASQWLGLRNLDTHEPDTEETFAGFDPTLKDAMKRETELLFLHVVRNNLSVAELLTADYTFLNQALGKHYGVSAKGSNFQLVSLESTPRRGLLSHASMLTMTSESTRTSPVKRGKWILENVLGTPPPDPPANVPALEETKVADENASLREQLEIHRESPACASCHRVMDQLGFGLEQFDAIGRYRESENGQTVDASGVLPGGRKFQGAAELSAMLGKTERESFAKTIVHRLLTFALGRELKPSDRCVVDEIVNKAKEGDYRFIDLVQAIVDSRPFNYYEVAN